MLTREQIISAVVNALEPLDFINALWEGGSAAFGRVDALSDVDLHVDVADDKVAEAFAAVEAALSALSPIAHTYDVPQPTWHGHHQRFYRLADAPEFLLVDCAVMRASSTNKFLEREIHGDLIVHFDKTGATAAPEFDGDALQEQLRRRVAEIGAFFEMVHNFPLKEVRRGQPLDALAFYHGLVLRPLAELLRIQHDPTRYNWSLRYLYHVLPAADLARLEDLAFVAAAADIERKLPEAQRWVHDLLKNLRAAENLPQVERKEG